MCGRFVQTAPPEALAARFRAVVGPGVPALLARYNVPPSAPAYVVGYHPALRRRGLTAMTWGLVPRWWEGHLRAAPKPANAVAETVEAKSFFRDSFRRRRCLVPVAGFYEWKAAGDAKAPYYVHPAVGGGFALGGVWDVWTDPDTGEKRFSFAVLTTTPNELVRAVHTRMPVVVPEAAWAEWLDPAAPLPGVRRLLVPLPAGRMAMHPVSPLVNATRNDGPELLAPAA